MLAASLQTRSNSSWPVSPFLVAGLLVAAELATGMRYGLFRDELYYLACAERLSWGYVDHPPLSIAVLAVVRALFGDSQLALRLVPAFVGGANVLLAAAIARELGGRGFAMAVAALSVAIVPVYLAFAGFYSMNPLDVLAWSVATLLLVRILACNEPSSWLTLGLVVGLGLLNKFSMAFFLVGLGVAVLTTSTLRKQLATRELWLGLGLALAVVAPHLIWQVRHDWPTLEFMHNASTYKNVALSPLDLLLAQIELIHPLNVPLWLGGLSWLLFGQEGQRFRALAVVWLTVFAVLAVQGAKGYYLAASFVLLLPAGAVAFEGVLERRGLAWPRVAVPVLLLCGGLVLAPFVMPVLPVERFINYQSALGLAPRQAERSELGPLPQLFADRFGWIELTESVARVVAALPRAERSELLLATSNYGEASALNYFGRPYHLPRAVSTHNNYFLWGPGVTNAKVVITVGVDMEDVRALFEVCAEQPRTTSPYAMPYESEGPILICRGPKMKLEDMWKRGKSYI